MVTVFEVELNGVRQAINNMDELHAATKAVTDELKQQTFNSTGYRELQRTLGTLKAAEKEFGDERKKNANLATRDNITVSSSYRNMVARINELRDNYRNFTDQERSSPIGRSTIREIKQLSNGLNEIDRNLGTFRNSFQGAVQGVNQLSGALASVFAASAGGSFIDTITSGALGTAVAGLTGNIALAGTELAQLFLQLGSQTVSLNAEISDSAANVQKSGNLTKFQVDQLVESLKGIDTRTSLKDLLTIGTTIGQLGLTVDEKTVPAFDRLNVALEDEFNGNTQLAVETVAKLRNVLSDFKTDDVAQDIIHLGNALNKAGQEGIATAPVISDFATRIAGTLGPLGISAAQILGVSTALQELGTTAERGSSGFTRIISKIVASPQAFADKLKITKQAITEAGFEAENFAELVKKDVFGAFQVVTRQIDKFNLTNTDLINLLAELKIRNIGEKEVLGKLSSNYELLTEKVELHTVALQNESSITREFNIRNENLAANLSKLGNTIAEKFINSEFADWMSGIVKTLIEWTDNTTELSDQMIDQQAELYQLSFRINDVNLSHEDSVAILKTLKQEYPGYFDAIDEEKIDLKELNKIVDSLNQAYVYRIALQSNYEEIQKGLKTVANAKNKSSLEEVRLLKEISKIQELRKRQGREEIILGTDILENAEKLRVAQRFTMEGSFDLSAAVLNYTKSLKQQTNSEKENLNVIKEKGEQNDLLLKQEGAYNKVELKNIEVSANALVEERKRIQALIITGKLKEAQTKANDLLAKSEIFLANVKITSLEDIKKYGVENTAAASTVLNLVNQIKQYDKELKNISRTPRPLEGEGGEPKAKKKAKEIENNFKEILRAEEKYIEDKKKLIQEGRNELTDLQLDLIKDETDKLIAAENRRYEKQLQDLEKNTNAFINSSTDAETEILDNIEKAEKEKKRLQEGGVKDLSEINNQIIELKNKLFEFSKTSENDLTEFLKSQNKLRELEEYNHQIKIGEAIDKGNAIKQSKEEEQAKKNIDKLDATYKKQLDDLTTSTLDSIAEIQRARQAAIAEALKTLKGEKLKKKLIEIDAQFDITEFDIKKKELEGKIQLANVELQDALQLYYSVSDTVAINPGEIERLKKQLIETQKELQKAVDYEAEKANKDGIEAATKKTGDDPKTKFKKYLGEIADLADTVTQGISDAAIRKSEKENDIKIKQTNEYYDHLKDQANGNAIEEKRIEEQRLKALENLNKEFNEKQKKIAINQAIISGALAVLKAFASLDPVSATIAAVGIAATTAFEISKIEDTTFASGGFTGKGGNTKPDHTGEKPVGVVHANEYVVPRKVLQTEEGYNYVSKLERLRKKYIPTTQIRKSIGSYATGGFTNEVVSNQNNGTNQLMLVKASIDEKDLEKLGTIVEKSVISGMEKSIPVITDTNDKNQVKRDALNAKLNI